VVPVRKFAKVREVTEKIMLATAALVLGLARSAPHVVSRAGIARLSAPASVATGNAAACCAYFEAWNRRDMQAAIDLFSEDVVYEDTVYPDVFKDREELRYHLLRVADALPASFQFVVDDVSSGPPDAVSVGVKWHVESNGNQLPFTRGVSFYTFDAAGKIKSGMDFVEPSIKPGDASLAVLSLASKVLRLLGR
jgi:ketosteroid isomerase-like protein